MKGKNYGKIDWNAMREWNNAQEGVPRGTLQEFEKMSKYLRFTTKSGDLDYEAAREDGKLQTAMMTRFALVDKFFMFSTRPQRINMLKTMIESRTH